MNIAVELRNVYKKYEIHHEKPTLVEKFIKGSNETFFALRNINLAITKGERVGIIGPNGSGKTTLLKIIAGITAPTVGTVETHGNIVSLIDLEAGFHPDLTGVQNIYLNGMLVGLSRKEIDRNLTNIIKFADIHQFIDVPLYTYSSGMKLRLGFSIAVHSRPDILILDENLSVGDSAFQSRADKKMKKLFARNITTIMVSHNVDFIRKHATRILRMERGRLI